jgi:hypothetical protein
MLWRKLYGTVWLAFFSCVLIPRWIPVIGLSLHFVVGLAMLIMTQSNKKSLAAMPVPERLKRISKVTAGFVILQLISGMVIGAAFMGSLFRILPPAFLFKISGAIRIIHDICALVILAQASSVATAYDMWEEKEFAPAQDSSSAAAQLPHFRS